MAIPGYSSVEFMRAEIHSTSLAMASPVGGLYHFWLTSWETALTAVKVASQAGTLSASDAAAHTAVIGAERELVTRQLIQLG